MTPGPVASAAPGGGEPGPPFERPHQREPAARPGPRDGRHRGLWVLCEGSQRVLDDPARIEGLLARARALGTTDLFVQVYRGGRAWYDATLADPTPYRTALAAHGVDPLAVLLARAHAEGLRVHGWVNVLALHDHPDAPIVRELGPGAVQVDSRGRSLLDYPGFELPPPDSKWLRMGTPGVYLDPAAPGVAAHLVAVFRELVARYPALDGLHLDYIRYPGVLPFSPGSSFEVGLGFGYGEASVRRFAQETDQLLTEGDRPRGPRWDTWRRQQVTALVAGVREGLRVERADLKLSAAVISYSDRAYLSLFQDWRRWLEEDLIDFAVPMVYTRDDALFTYQLRALAGSAPARRLWAGLGVWLFAGEPERARAQVAIARGSRLAGEALFSDDAIAEAPALLEALRRDGPDDRP